ncbi:AcrB/AcrD/AcrF family protein [Neobacillus piezotolerans]|uniref:AcrB/AcrD/AcrF family protein n=1 Tax=Neobacillus piezotolerans TaxID=2259171 RepID=A0A3D8GMR3_9BACI|nr:efflux RND transporter permease subunit [Neobacillus piezotolerans]RDU35784.1 AcrB/AcrD/AcrF family protein [Neobacillus piezotolerans]
MKHVIDFSLKNKFAIWLLTIMVTVAGLYSGIRMKLETLPDITIPVITVTTILPGASPEEVAEKISEPMEKRLQNLDGVKNVSSSSYQNASSLQIEYSYKKDMEEAKREADEALNGIQLPDGAGEPEITRISFNAFPIIAMSVSDESESLAGLTKAVEGELVPALEGLEGVASVQISGQNIEEGQLVFKKEQLAKYGLTEDTIRSMLKGSAISMPLGLYTLGEAQKSILVDGQITTLDDLKKVKIPVIPSAAGGAGQGAPGNPSEGQIPLNPAGAAGNSAAQQPGAGQGFGNGQNPSAANPSTSGQVQMPGSESANPSFAGLPTVELQGIADVNIVGRAESISRTNGKESIGLQIIKAPEANTVEVANEAKEELKKFEKEWKKAEFTITFDQGTPIEESVKTMLNKALFGALFAVVIILLFLRSIKSTIISVISIPLSLLIAILALKQMDITLNIMTLGAMTVAIGRVIDDSIVVIENIYRRMSLKTEKLEGKELIKSSTLEMFIPIFSSTIVTVAVFLPLGFVEGQIGELFLPFALTIVFALMASLLVAVTLVPMLAHTLFKKGAGAKHSEGKPGRLAGTYRNILEWSLNHKIVTFGLAVLLLAGSFLLVPKIGVSFIPSEEEKMAILTFNPAPGQTLEQVTDTAANANDFLLERKDVQTVQYSAGGRNPMNPGASNQAMFFVKYDNKTEDFENEKERVVKALQDRTEKGEWATQDFSGAGASNSITYYVYGETLQQLEPVVGNIESIMKDNQSLKNVETSISASYEEYALKVDQEKASKLGLTAGQVGMALMQERERPVAAVIQKDGRDITVYVQADKKEFKDINDVTNQTVASPLGMDVKISGLVSVEKGKTSDTVHRRNGKLFVSVGGELRTKDVAKVSADIQKEVDKLTKPTGVDIKTGGVTEDIKESFTQLGMAMLAAVAIVYFILVLTFGGALAPFAILFSLPFSIIGGLVALLIAKETISISAMIGALMLIGIVVTNAIVLIDRVIHKEKEGYTVREALLEAGVTRLRPILMTAIATIGALIPLALGVEGSGVISRGLGVTVIGGLTSSTLLTLVIVPIVYEALKRPRKKKA